MARKPVSLAVHRNRIESRRKRELAGDMARQIPALIKDQDIRAYAFIAIDSRGESHAIWDTGAIMPMWCFPDTVSAMLRRDMECCGVKEDWKPMLRSASDA